MIVKLAIALAGMLIVGWIAWRLLDRRGLQRTNDHVTPDEMSVEPPDKEAE